MNGDDPKKVSSKSLFDEPINNFIPIPLSDYHGKAYDEIDDYSDETQLSFIHKDKVSHENDPNLINEDPENIEISDEEGAQRPWELDVRAQELIIENDGKENIIPTPQSSMGRKINFSAVPQKENDAEKVLAKTAISKVINKSKDNKIVVNLLKDFKEGWLEKKSHSLLKPWKEKYCRLGNLQFSFYKNVATGWLSGFIDFRRVRTKITVDKALMCFM